MNPSTSASRPASVETKAAAALREAALPEAQRVVLRRIAAQRDRLNARRNARAQALALRAEQAPHIRADAPLPERLLAFARLHPVAVAAAAGVALMLGPGRLIRWTGIVLPLVARLRR